MKAHNGVTAQQIPEDGVYPNNERLPLLIYKAGIAVDSSDPASRFEVRFRENGWGGSWRNGIFDDHHYHSTAHEVLGVYAGQAEVQFGGPDGPVLTVAAGDVVVIPAGVAHRRRSASRNFRVVGAYPSGQRPDMKTGKPGERPQADHSIAAVSLPGADPVYGAEGPLTELWKPKPT